MKPLTKKFRHRTFILMVVVFALATPLLLGYSKGYRLNDALLLIQTGGIYLHSDVSNTSVFLDDTFVENNGAFLRNTLIQDLTPNKTYAVRVEKVGYQSWVKRLPVIANLVTEARVLMLPQEFVWKIVHATSTVALAGTSSDASTTRSVENPEYVQQRETFLDDHDQFMVEVATTTYEFVRGVPVATTTTVFEPQFPAWLSDLASTSDLASKQQVREREGIVGWLENGDLVVVWARTNDTPPYYFCTTTCKQKLVIDWQEPILRYEFYPNRNDVVILGTARGIYAVELDDRSQRNIQPILEAPNLDFRLEGNGTLIVFDGTEFRETSW
jgi:hypothetical protein